MNAGPAMLAALLLTALYVLLVESFTLWDVGFGLVLAMLLLHASRSFVLPRVEGALPLQGRLAAFPLFAAALVFRIFRGTWQVMLLTLGLAPRYRPGILVVHLPEATPSGLVVFALAQSLAPGSVALEIDLAGSTILFHVIGEASADEIRQGFVDFYRRRQRRLFP